MAVLIDVKRFDELFLIQCSFKRLEGPEEPTVVSDLDRRFPQKSNVVFYFVSL